MTGLQRSRLAVEQIESFATSEKFDPFAEGYIVTLCVRSAAVMCISEVEEVITEIIKNKLKVAIDEKAANFVTNNLATIIKRTSKSDIAKTIALFGESCKDDFNQAVPDQEVSAYGTILNVRHSVAHSDGGDITFSDLKNGVSAAELLIDQFEIAIN